MYNPITAALQERKYRKKLYSLRVELATAPARQLQAAMIAAAAEAREDARTVRKMHRILTGRL